MKDRISKLIDELKSIIEHDTYALSENNISELSWKIDKLKSEILKMYEGKRLD